MLLNAEDNLLHYRAGYGYLSDKVSGEGRGFTLKIGEGLAGWVVEQRESALINDLVNDFFDGGGIGYLLEAFVTDYFGGRLA